MNKFWARTLTTASLATPFLAGCAERYRNAVDPCYPERYSFTARKEVVDAFAPQVQNGEILDQTVWNYMFANGTDEINAMGREKLNYIIRRRPAPDPNVFLQTAHDIAFDPAQPDKLSAARQELDQKRIAAMQRYLSAMTVGRPAQFEFAVHDPFPVGANSAYAAGSARLANTPATSGVLGTLSGTAGASGQSGTTAQQTQAGPTSGATGGATGAGATGSQPPQ